MGNRIGTDRQGTIPLGNGLGILVADDGPVTIRGTTSGEANTIAYSTGVGVYVSGGTGRTIRGNAIYGNAGLGIDLAATA